MKPVYVLALMFIVLATMWVQAADRYAAEVNLHRAPLSRQGFDQIKSGMTESQVVTLMGEDPKDVTRGTSPVTGDTQAKLDWVGHPGTVTCKFKNDKLLFKVGDFK